MIGRLTQFVDRLRQVGIPVSTSEAIDAADALGFVSWDQREVFRSTLGATLVKNSAHLQTFETLFDLFFPATLGERLEIELTDAPDDMSQELIDALMRFDLARLEELAAEAVRRYAQMEPGRPVGGRYYQWRVEQALRMADLQARLAEILLAGGAGTDGEALGIAASVAGEDAAVRIAELRRRIERLIRGRLVEERGPEVMARALARPLPEEVDFLQATSEDLGEMRRTIAVLARRLASRLAYKHHQSHRGRLDFRRTIRRSLEVGGVPINPRLRHRVHRPEIVALCDLSGSVAAFSRFTLSLLYSLSQHFRKIRSFAFIDTLDEVTHYFEDSDFEEAIVKLRNTADLVWIDGHSDYGHSFREFMKRYSDSLGPRTTVLILGDCRSNFRSPEAWALKQIRERVRKTYLLNPEPHRYWDTGDSIVSTYEEMVDGVFECRNLAQLAHFIERL